VRLRSNENMGAVPLEAFVEQVTAINRDRSPDLWRQTVPVGE